MRSLKPVLLTGLLAGILDLSGACIGYMLDHQGKFPSKILEYIASGVFGKEAYAGGLSMKLYGLLFHFLIAMLFTFFYFFIYPKIKFLHKNVLFSAFIYGLFVWAVMNLIVVPNSAINKSIIAFDFVASAKAAFILMLCIALPDAYFAKKYYKGSRR